MIIHLTSEDTIISVSPKHPNKLNFSATVAYVDEPSDKAPCGSNGKLLVLRKEAVEKALSSMDLMAINCSAKSGFTEHDPREKVGLVTKSFVEGNALKCNGFFYALDYPDIAYVIKNAVDTMGFSIEASIVAYEEDETNVYVTDLIFTGLSAVFAESAAFTKTHIDYLVASANKTEITKENDNDMTPEQIAELMSGMKAMQDGLAGVQGTIGTMKCSLDEVKADVDGIKAKAEKAPEVAPTVAEVTASAAVVAPVQAMVDAVSASAAVVAPATPYVAQVQAQADPTAIPVPTAVQASVQNPALGADKLAKIEQINANASMSFQQKIKEITNIRLA